MYRVAVVGHSLVPESVQGPGLDVSVFRKPGGKLTDLHCGEFTGFRQGHFDLAIIVLGGNDLAGPRPVSDLLDLARMFVDYAKGVAREVRFCTAEIRMYGENNRFGVNNEVYKRRRNKYNRTLVRMLRRENVRHVDLGKPWFAYERARDGVHFSPEAEKRFEREIVRVSLGVKGSELS